MTASAWNPGSNNIPLVDPLSQIKSQVFTATEGQTDFTITQFTYTPGNGALSVYVNRAKLKASLVTELSTTTFRVPACDVDDEVEVVANTAIQDPNSAVAQAVAAAAAAAASETNAATSETNAALSETAAALSETNAADSAALAATYVPMDWVGDWTTAVAYVINDGVSYLGNGYVCREAHTSGVFATDLGAGKWQLISQKGADGRGIVSVVRTSGTGAPGTADTYTITYTDATTSTYQVWNGTNGTGLGDMIAANNLSDLTNVSTARANLGLGTAATTDSTAYATAAQGSLADTALQTDDIGTSVQAYDADIAVVPATQAEMEAGTETANRSMSPFRVKQAIQANVILNTDADISWDSATDTYFRSNGIAATEQVTTATHLGMRRCTLLDTGAVNYYLSPFNSNYKADGSASILTGADGQVMVEIPAFYVKLTVTGTVRNYAISSVAKTGYTLHPAFTKDGSNVAYRYCGAYDACVFNGSVYESGLNWDNNWSAGQNWQADGSNAKLASVSGVHPAIGATRANFRAMAANRGTAFRQLDFYLLHAIQLLYLVEYGSFNSQTKLGDGNVAVSSGYPADSGTQTDSPHSAAGKSNTLGNSSTNPTIGASKTARDSAFMSYRGIENFYGNCWTFIDGFNINSNQAYVSNTRSTFADDTSTGYSSIGSAMVASDGWVTDMQSIQFGFLPSTVGGSSSTYVGDYYYQASGWRIAIFGGLAVDALLAGAFDWYLAGDSGAIDRAIGGRLAA